jgi:hypothetical protein
MRKLTALLVLVLAVGCKDSKLAVDLQGIPPATQSQRYQIIANSAEWTGSNSQVFLLDTVRGRVWGYSPHSPSTNIPENFSPIDVIDDEGVLGLTASRWQELIMLLKNKQKDSKHE